MAGLALTEALNESGTGFDDAEDTSYARAVEGGFERGQVPFHKLIGPSCSPEELLQCSDGG